MQTVAKHEQWRCTPGQRRVSLVIRIVIVVAALVAGCAIFFFPLWAAYPAAVLIAAAVFALIFDCRFGSIAHIRMGSAQESERRAGMLMFLRMVVLLAASSLLITAILVGWQLAAVAAIGVFLWLGVIGLPFWLAAITEAVEDEHVRQTGEHRMNE